MEQVEGGLQTMVGDNTTEIRDADPQIQWNYPRGIWLKTEFFVRENERWPKYTKTRRFQSDR